MSVGPARFERIVIGNSEAAAWLAYHLVKESVWFTCDPLPDDAYWFKVKADQSPRLNRLVDTHDQYATDGTWTGVKPGRVRGGYSFTDREFS